MKIMERTEGDLTTFSAVMSDGVKRGVCYKGVLTKRARAWIRKSFEATQAIIDGIWPYGNVGKPAEAPDVTEEQRKRLLDAVSEKFRTGRVSPVEEWKQHA